MNPNSHSNPQSVRRIVLPSGRTIEVVRFHDEVTPSVGLHICPKCDLELVQPIEWAESAKGSAWELTLECPNCWWADSGRFGPYEGGALEEKLDEGVEDILRDLQR